MCGILFQWFFDRAKDKLPGYKSDRYLLQQQNLFPVQYICLSQPYILCSEVQGKRYFQGVRKCRLFYNQEGYALNRYRLNNISRGFPVIFSL